MLTYLYVDKRPEENQQHINRDSRIMAILIYIFLNLPTCLWWTFTIVNSIIWENQENQKDEEKFTQPLVLLYK